VLIGPEGGLAEAEQQAAVAAGFVPVRLGPRVLRTETAAIAALSLLQREFGDLYEFPRHIRANARLPTRRGNLAGRDHGVT
jgi:RNA methyltransferase